MDIHMVALPPDSSARQDRLPSEDVLRALRSALGEHLSTPSPNGNLHHALQLLVREAKAEHLKAEELILLFKRLWDSLPEVQRAERHIVRELRTRLVSLCIASYYDEPRVE